MRSRRRPLAGRALKLSVMRAKSAPPPVTSVHPPRHERAISAPHRWSGAAERGEPRPTRSDRSAPPAGLRVHRRPRTGPRAEREGATKATECASGTSHGGRPAAGHLRPAASPSAANSPQQTRPSHLPGPPTAIPPTVPQPISDLRVHPSPAPGTRLAPAVAHPEDLPPAHRHTVVSLSRARDNETHAGSAATSVPRVHYPWRDKSRSRGPAARTGQATRSMTTKEQLHQLIDTLADEQADRALAR